MNNTIHSPSLSNEYAKLVEENSRQADEIERLHKENDKLEQVISFIENHYPNIVDIAREAIAYAGVKP